MPLPSLVTDLTSSSSRAPSHGLCAAGESLIDSTSPSSDLRRPSQGHDPSNTWPDKQRSPGDRWPPCSPEIAVPFVYSMPTWERPGPDAEGKLNPFETRPRYCSTEEVTFPGFGRSVHRWQAHEVHGATLPAPAALRMATGSRTHTRGWPHATKRAAVTTGPGRADGCMLSLL